MSDSEQRKQEEEPHEGRWRQAKGKSMGHHSNLATICLRVKLALDPALPYISGLISCLHATITRSLVSLVYNP